MHNKSFLFMSFSYVQIRYARQLGWAQPLRESGGAATPKQAWRFGRVVRDFILSADGIEPW
jgi:hypothetical protein